MHPSTNINVQDKETSSKSSVLRREEEKAIVTRGKLLSKFLQEQKEGKSKTYSYTSRAATSNNTTTTTRWFTITEH